MQRRELLARLHRWLARMSDDQLHALADDIRESMPEVCDARYDAVVGKVRDLLGGQEDAEAITRLLREKGCLKAVLR